MSEKTMLSFATTKEQANRIGAASRLYGVSRSQMLRAIIQKGLSDLMEKTNDKQIFVSVIDPILVNVPEDYESGYVSDQEARKAMLEREQKISNAIAELRA